MAFSTAFAVRCDLDDKTAKCEVETTDVETGKPFIIKVSCNSQSDSKNGTVG